MGLTDGIKRDAAGIYDGEPDLTPDNCAEIQCLFAKRMTRATKNQEFVEQMFGDDYDTSYSQLRKIEMHYLLRLSRGIQSFIATLHCEDQEVEKILRMYYGFSVIPSEFGSPVEYAPPMSIKEIAESLGVSTMDIDVQIKRGMMLLRDSDREYLFDNLSQFKKYEVFHEKLSAVVSEFVLDINESFDEYDQCYTTDMATTFAFKESLIFDDYSDCYDVDDNDDVIDFDDDPIFESETEI